MTTPTEIALPLDRPAAPPARRLVLRSVGALGFAGLMAACASRSTGSAAEPEAEGSSAGGSEVSRVVALDVLTTLALLHLGIIPVGAPDIDRGLYVTVGGELDNTTDIGTETELDVEQVLALRADLAVGIDFGDGVIGKVDDGGLAVTEAPFTAYGWREHHLAVGEAVGRADLAREQVAEADERLAALARQVPSGSVLGVIGYSPSEASVYYYTGWFPADVLDDLGFGLPAGRGFEPDAVEAGSNEGGVVSLPVERLAELGDADVLLVPRTADGAPGAALEEFTSLSVAATLPAVARGAVAEVGFDVWGYQSVGNVLRIADDIEQLVLPQL